MPEVTPLEPGDAAIAPAVFERFRHSYPMGSLISELLQVHGDRYVVRAMVQVGGVTLATGMATATQIEQAEDRARLRALAVLGLASPGLPLVAPVNLTFQSTSPSAEPVAPGKMPPAPIKPLAKSGAAPTVASVPPNLLFQAESSVPEFEPEPVPSLAPPEPTDFLEESQEEMNSPDPFPLEDFPALSREPIDTSDLIAQIDTEMMRVGWTKEQGRDYLKTTYRKRSRQLLSEDELLDFLHFLKALPSGGGAPF